MSKSLKKLESMIKFFEERHSEPRDRPLNHDERAEFRDVFNFAEDLLPEYSNFISSGIGKSEEAYIFLNDSLKYMKKLREFIKLKISLEENIEDRKLFLGADEQYRSAIEYFSNDKNKNNLGPVFSFLGTAIDLVLKDKLDLPSTLPLKENNVKKMLDIIGKHTSLGIFCNEIYKNVYDLRSKVGHDGFNPTPKQTINALKLTEDFIRKIKPISLNSDLIKTIHNESFS